MPSHDDQRHPAPVIYRALTTRRSSYPKWVFLKSSPIPLLMKRVDLGNDAYTTLISVQCAIIVPPILNNVADCLRLLLFCVPFPCPVGRCYRVMTNMLYTACLPSSQIHLFDTHNRIALCALASMILFHPGHEETYYSAIECGKRFIENRWGNRIRFIAEFDQEIIDIYLFLREVSYNGSC
jgi:hypothetical protein